MPQSEKLSLFVLLGRLAALAKRTDYLGRVFRRHELVEVDLLDVAERPFEQEVGGVADSLLCEVQSGGREAIHELNPLFDFGIELVSNVLQWARLGGRVDGIEYCMHKFTLIQGSTVGYSRFRSRLSPSDGGEPSASGRSGGFVVENRER